jgi:hypothetical protein
VCVLWSGPLCYTVAGLMGHSMWGVGPGGVALLVLPLQLPPAPR